MHSPTLPLVCNSPVHFQGDVRIDPSACIAAGVVLRADPDSQITIAAGVCIGMGSIFHAHQGILEVEAGATVGAGVLVVGKGKIGSNACIGALTTIWNSSIDAWQVVPPASLIGDKGREIAEISEPATSTPVDNLPEVNLDSTSTASDSSDSNSSEDTLNGQVTSNQAVAPAPKNPNNTDEEQPPIESTQSSSEPNNSSVHGQNSLNRLLKTLFPYNSQYLNLPSPPEDD
ncbi:MAG: transferase [Symploca sp. SIO2B6]|nr:transferase [Symploca sp. SIO2B6]